MKTIVLLPIVLFQIKSRKYIILYLCSFKLVNLSYVSCVRIAFFVVREDKVFRLELFLFTLQGSNHSSVLFISMIIGNQ